MTATPTEPLFADRVPEAAARQLAVALAWLTECELATLERLQMMRKPPKGQLARHEGICDKAVEQCFELGVYPRGLRGEGCQRLKDRLDAIRAKVIA